MRTRLLPSTLLLATMALAAACGDHNSSPTEAPALNAPPPTVPIRAVGIRIAPDSITLALGAETPLRVFRTNSDGSEVPVKANWVSIDHEGSVFIDGRTGTVSGIRAGWAEVGAYYYEGAKLLTSPYTGVYVRPPIGTAATGALQIDEFWIEGDGSSYAPQVRVSANGGGGHLLSAIFRASEYPWPLATLKCNRTLLDNQSVYLNGEIYGDWTLAFDFGGARLQADSTTVELRYLTPEGMLVTTSARGPVRPGGPPATFTAGMENAGPCWSQ